MFRRRVGAMQAILYRVVIGAIVTALLYSIVLP
jgi:hypothetical protein